MKLIPLPFGEHDNGSLIDVLDHTLVQKQEHGGLSPFGLLLNATEYSPQIPPTVITNFSHIKKNTEVSRKRQTTQTDFIRILLV